MAGMTLSEALTYFNITPSAGYSGVVTGADMALFIDTDPTAQTPTAVTAYKYVGMRVKDYGASIDSETTDSNFYYEGKSTTKTAVQRNFSLSGERRVGDDAQDFMLSHDVKFGLGSACETNYLWINLLTGKGETGKVMIDATNDGSGEAGSPAEITIDLKGQVKPTAYTYSTGSTGP